MMKVAKIVAFHSDFIHFDKKKDFMHQMVTYNNCFKTILMWLSRLMTLIGFELSYSDFSSLEINLSIYLRYVKLH